MKDFFVNGPISPLLIAKIITNFQNNTSIGAHSSFIGQVRADKIEDNSVSAIEYTAYLPVVESEFQRLKYELFEKFKIIDLTVKHSIGEVSIGQICLFINVAAGNRKSAISATNYILEFIKSRLPIFGKEIFENQSHQWKVNS